MEILDGFISAISCLILVGFKDELNLLDCTYLCLKVSLTETLASFSVVTPELKTWVYPFMPDNFYEAAMPEYLMEFIVGLNFWRATSPESEGFNFLSPAESLVAYSTLISDLV